MYSICVRDHFMVAHSLKGDLFGPAQGLHGATYVVDVELRREGLDENGVVVDIGLAAEAVRSVLAEFNYRNLDAESIFDERNTTTEFLAHIVFDRLEKRIRSGELGDTAHELHSMRITLRESHIAWATYENTLINAEP